jgi:hypothetical protein
MSRVEGVVWKVYDREFRGQTTYTIKIDGNPLYYRAGTKRWAGIAEPGNRVAFDAEPNPDGTSGKITGDVTLASPPPAVASAPSAGGGGGGGNAGLQMRYQGALERAILFVDLAVKNEAIKLPAAAAKRLGVLEAAVDRYTAQFYEDTNILGAVIREAEGGETPEPTSAPDDEDE